MGNSNAPAIPDGSVALAFLNLGAEDPAQPVGSLMACWPRPCAPLAWLNAHTHCPEAARLGRLRLVNGHWQA